MNTVDILFFPSFSLVTTVIILWNPNCLRRIFFSSNAPLSSFKAFLWLLSFLLDLQHSSTKNRIFLLFKQIFVPRGNTAFYRQSYVFLLKGVVCLLIFCLDVFVDLLPKHALNKRIGTLKKALTKSLKRIGTPCKAPFIITHNKPLK